MGAPAAAVADLLVIGELCVDLIIEVGDEIRFGQHEQIVPRTTLTMGSSSAITACGAAALGIRTRLISVRGDDVFGRFLDAELVRRGVDTSGVRVDDSLPTGASTHLTRPDGDRAILTSMGSIGAVTAADAPESRLSAAGHLHAGSYFLQHALQPEAAELFRLARSRGLRTSLDGNFDPSQEWDSGILEVLRHVDVFFGNNEELTGITGASDIDGAVEQLLRIMPEGATVVAKLGAEGAEAVRIVDSVIQRSHADTPSLDAPLVDTVGAGDTLAAGFIAALLRGEGVERALALAVACGTASTRGAGGVGAQPDRTTAEALAAEVRVTAG